MYHVEIDIASRTPKQDDDQEEYDQTAQLQQPVVPPEEPAQLDNVMNMLPMKLHETAWDFE